MPATPIFCASWSMVKLAGEQEPDLPPYTGCERVYLSTMPGGFSGGDGPGPSPLWIYGNGGAGVGLAPAGIAAIPTIGALSTCPAAEPR